MQTNETIMMDETMAAGAYEAGSPTSNGDFANAMQEQLSWVKAGAMKAIDTFCVRSEWDDVFETTEEVAVRFEVDSRHQMVRIATGTIALIRNDWTYLRFDQIASFEVLENDSTLGGHGVGRAVVGTMIAGGVGAVVGAITQKKADVCDSLRIRITVRDAASSTYFYDIIRSRTKKASWRYRDAIGKLQQVISALELVLEATGQVKQAEVEPVVDVPVVEMPQVVEMSQHEVQVERRPSAQSQASSVDPVAELRRYKALLDDGIITQEEFNWQKALILGTRVAA